MKAPARAILTTERTLGEGPAQRQGTLAAYRSVAELAGEPHAIRAELVSSAPARVRVRGEPLGCLAHITDVHMTDAQSPARFEFVNRHWSDPRFRELLTMQRPQETLNPRALEALVRTVNQVEAGPLTGLPVQLVAMTGDAVDNTQRNELANFVALMNGGEVRPDSGDPGYQGVQLPEWPAEYCWKPGGPEDGDEFQRRLGFPRHPGLLEQAMTQFRAEGLRTPWLGCYGNHEQVCQGVGVVTAGLAAAMAGQRKPVELPSDIDPDHAVEIFTHHPERFMTGPALDVAADAERRPISRAEFMAAQNRREAHYVHDSGPLRFIALDTVCDTGGADGSVDATQLEWLEQQLSEAAGRCVVVLSHHGLDTLSNPLGERRAAQLLQILLSSDRVVLWLNGHIHANRITARPGGSGGGGGFWEVTTSALVDWPCQARLVELFETDSGHLAIACTMLDHDGAGLAGLHREIAANNPAGGFGSWRAGSARDRNAVLLLPSRCA